MFRSRSIQIKSGEEENPFLLSFSDLMASLLAIFIFVLIVTLVELEKRREELRLSKDELIESLEGIKEVQEGVINSLTGVSNREQYLSNMLEGIQRDLEKQGVKIVIAENGTVLRIPEQLLQFSLGKYEIPVGQFNAANIIGHALTKALQQPQNRTLLDTVFLEGHTDSVANGREMGNWGLSTYRAISLWNFWTEKPGELVELKKLQTLPADPAQPSKPLISVSGYADTRSTHGLLNGQGLKDDRPEDRRIDIRFTMVSSEKNDLENLNENLKEMSGRTDALIHKLRTTEHAP